MKAFVQDAIAHAIDPIKDKLTSPREENETIEDTYDYDMDDDWESVSKTRDNEW